MSAKGTKKTKTRKSVSMILITPFGMKRNLYSEELKKDLSDSPADDIISDIFAKNADLTSGTYLMMALKLQLASAIV